MWNSTAFSEKRSESRSTRSMQNYQYFEWGSTLNLDGFKIIIFQYIICEPFRSWKDGLVKLDVNLWEIWRKFKCRRSASGPPWLWRNSLNYFRSKIPGNDLKCPRYLWCSQHFDLVSHGMPYNGFNRVGNAEKHTKQHTSEPKSEVYDFI